MKKNLFVLFLLVLLIPSLSSAQRWKRIRKELSFGIGASNFLGELGGANRVGTNFYRDLEFVATRPVLSIGFRYKISQWLALKSSLTYARIIGNDKWTKEFHRNYRNLSFRSPIVELSTQIEPSIIKEKVGSRYRIR